MKLYNTLTGQLDPVTSDDGVFRMYVCGVTPYATTHLGHAFTYICFDVLERYLEYKGYETLTVQNVTDIDDDILRKANEEGIPWDELGKRETDKFIKDIKALNIRMPDHFPYATQEVPQIIDMVRGLLDKGYAYEVEGNVYYDIKKDSEFAHHLVDMPYEQLLATANERGNFPDDEKKRDPLDFVLWQAAQPGEPTWASPWGEGRPGWHIECSAMSMHYLGPKIDVHAGGSDLIFPHHSCEIAQSERYSGEAPFVRYWFHIAMVRMDGEKMSKSLGNMVFVRDLLKQHAADAIRLYLLSHHYRDPWSVDSRDEEIAQATERLRRIQAALEAASGDGEPLDVSTYEQAFVAAMDDDLHTGQAIAQLDALATAIIDVTGERDLHQAQTTLRTLCDVVGLSPAN